MSFDPDASTAGGQSEGTVPARARFVFIALAAVAGIAITVSLGRWQLARAAEKIAIHDAIEQRQAMPMVDGRVLAQPVAEANTPSAGAPADPLIHRRVSLRGQWLPRYTVYLDNRQMDGRPGFFVVTPLQLDRSIVVLVQRGWVPRDFLDRSRVPTVVTPEGEIDIQGRIALPPSQLYEFAGGAESSGSSAIRQNLDLPSYRRDTGLPIAGLSVLQTGDPSEGLQRRWPAIASGVEKHYGYAVQWFGLAALIAILYVWFQIIRRAPSRRRRDRA